jgi:hypothetical protein
MKNTQTDNHEFTLPSPMRNSSPFYLAPKEELTELRIILSWINGQIYADWRTSGFKEMPTTVELLDRDFQFLHNRDLTAKVTMIDFIMNNNITMKPIELKPISKSPKKII